MWDCFKFRLGLEYVLGDRFFFSFTKLNEERPSFKTVIVIRIILDRHNRNNNGRNISIYLQIVRSVAKTKVHRDAI